MHYSDPCLHCDWMCFFFGVFLQKNRSMLTVGSFSTEELDENYVPMNPNSPPRQHSNSCTEPIQETNYVPMTPGTFDFSAFGMQVPPPAHMGFRSSPQTPPRRSVLSTDCEPPPVDRNLKPHRKGRLSFQSTLLLTPTSTRQDYQLLLNLICYL